MRNSRPKPLLVTAFADAFASFNWVELIVALTHTNYHPNSPLALSCLVFKPKRVLALISSGTTRKKKREKRQALTREKTTCDQVTVHFIRCVTCTLLISQNLSFSLPPTLRFIRSYARNFFYRPYLSSWASQESLTSPTTIYLLLGTLILLDPCLIAQQQACIRRSTVSTWLRKIEHIAWTQSEWSPNVRNQCTHIQKKSRKEDAPSDIHKIKNLL